MTTESSSYGRFTSAPATPREQPSARLAWWALVLALVPFGPSWVVAAVLGVVVLRRGRDGRDHGERQAFVALVIVGLWGLLTVLVPSLFLGLADKVLGADEITRTQTLEVGDLRPGYCLRDALSEGSQAAVVVTPCDQPHAAEVFARFDLDVTRYPGVQETSELAAEGCDQRLPDDTDPDARLTYFVPRSPYNFYRDKHVVCLLDAPGAPG
ncbi:MAG: hypothetical protein OSB43_04275 [Nocardioides sp.]|uniref:hypothetical protein n=1 Tax=Nocardioides sp. TaxID=35761 RepID=UPI0023926DB9|nr:hypothetical protein [Nocardioides sp.]MDE0775473.1 hypothetical protein [Nocardioides sp.]